MGRMIAVALLFASTLASAAPLDGARIEQLTGAEGKLDANEGVFKVSVPRNGLTAALGKTSQ